MRHYHHSLVARGTSYPQIDRQGNASSYHPIGRLRFLDEANSLVSILGRIEGVRGVTPGLFKKEQRKKGSFDKVVVERYHESPPYQVEVRFNLWHVSQSMSIWCEKDSYQKIGEAVLRYSGEI